MNRFQQTLIKIGICAVIGTALGVWLAIDLRIWWLGILCPILMIGAPFGVSYMMKLLGTAGKFSLKAVFGAITHPSIGGLAMLIVALLVLPFLPILGCIPGFFIAIKTLLESRAEQPDGPKIIRKDSGEPPNWSPGIPPATPTQKPPALPARGNSDDGW